jgi:serine/threonine protein kinase
VQGDNQHYAVKTPARNDDLAMELETLETLANYQIPHTPTVHRLSIPTCLVLSPFATDLDTWLHASSRPPLPLSGFLQILTKTLHLLHSHGLVHADISLKNLLYTGDGRKESVVIYLNDWGSCVKTGSSLRECTRIFAADCVHHDPNAVAQPVMDLQAWIRCVLLLSWGSAKKYRKLTRLKEGIPDYWRKKIPTLLQDWMDDSGPNYNALQDAAVKYFPADFD